CIAESAEALPGLYGPDQAAWLDRTRDDLETYRTALHWLLDNGRPSDAAEIMWRTSFFWMIRGPASEGLQWCERALAAKKLPHQTETRALFAAALMLYTQRKLDRARPLLEKALALNVVKDDARVRPAVENLLGYIVYASGDIRAARDLFTRSIETF